MIAIIIMIIIILPMLFLVVFKDSFENLETGTGDRIESPLNFIEC